MFVDLDGPRNAMLISLAPQLCALHYTHCHLRQSLHSTEGIGSAKSWEVPQLRVFRCVLNNGYSVAKVSRFSYCWKMHVASSGIFI